MAKSVANRIHTKFVIENNVFISATDEINVSELQECITKLVEDGTLPPGTIFYMIGGIHHGKGLNKEIVEGQTDFTLLHGFYHKVYSHLIKLEIWNKREYGLKLVPITCSEELNFTTFKTDYVLSDISKLELLDLARKLLKGENPSLVVFASCFSFNSAIKDYLYSKGVMASLSISHDQGKVSDGKLFSLDRHQQEVIKRYDEVRDFTQ